MMGKAAVASLLFALTPALRAAAFDRAQVKMLGSIDYGETRKVSLSERPPYGAFEFNGNAGDQVEITVACEQSAAQAALADAKFTQIAGPAQRVTATLPAVATYYLILWSKDHRACEFSVNLERAGKPAQAAAAPEYLACSVDSDCVAVAREGCCHNGWKDAVNQSRLDAYRQANACKDQHVMCAQFLVNDDRVALCNTAQSRCEMMKPEEIPCGGFIRNQHACPDGYECAKSPTPDVGGRCVKR